MAKGVKKAKFLVIREMSHEHVVYSMVTVVNAILHI